jgi:GT2 family glycosyltransferase
VVPVRDRERQLEGCLLAIGRSASAIDHEVVVVDDGSRDGSCAVAAAAGARVVTADGLALGGVRNLGADESSGDVLAFIDSDVLVSPSWASAALAALDEDPATAAVGAPYRAPADGNWVQQTYDLLRSRTTCRRTARWLPAGALAVRRDAFRAVGGFDRRLQSCEDVDLCRRLRAAGHRIVHDPALDSVHHGDPRTLAAVFAGELRRGAANLRVSVRRHARGELPSLLASLAVLMLTLLLAPTLAAAVGGETLPLAAVAAALAALLALRGARMTRLAGWRRLPAALAVASLYELGRAVALVTGGVEAARSRRSVQ